MKAQFLKLAGVKSEEEFYRKFPTEESFMMKHGGKIKKAVDGDLIGGGNSVFDYKPSIIKEPLITNFKPQYLLPEENRNPDNLLPLDTTVVNPKSSRKQVDPTTGIMLGLTALDATIPVDRVKQIYNRPEQNIGQNIQPTGSQAIMKKGGKMKKCDSGGNPTDTVPRKNIPPEILKLMEGRKKSMTPPINMLEELKAINSGIKGGYTPTERDSVAATFNKAAYYDQVGSAGFVPLVDGKPVTKDIYVGDKKVTAKRMAFGGKVSVDGLTQLENGSITQLSDNPYDGGTQLFNGPSHEDGGIKINHDGTPVEVEGDETKVRDTVMGNMKAPGFGKKFKNVIKDIAVEENKVSSVKNKAVKLAEEASVNSFKSNTAKIMLEGSDLKQKQLADKKEWLSNIQQAMLEVADAHNLDPQAMSKGKIVKADDGIQLKSKFTKRINPSIFGETPDIWNQPVDVNSLPSTVQPQVKGVGIFDKIGNRLRDAVDATVDYSKIFAGIPQNPITVNQNGDLPSNGTGVGLTEIAPELVALGQNQVKGVRSQSVIPDLLPSYDVNLQGTRNRVTGAARGIQQMLGYNPAAAASIAANTQEQIQGVDDKEFQTNLGLKANVIGENIKSLNEAKYKNAQLADTQYLRQEEALSKTKAQSNEILKSISAKVLQNKLDNKKLKLYENLYKFRFDPETGKAIWMGGDANFDNTASTAKKQVTETEKQGNKTTTTKSIKTYNGGDISPIRRAKM